MTNELTMPALSPTMEKGTLAKWLVAEGDMVAEGDLIAEIETDKATMELEASAGGRIARLLVAEGTDDIAVGSAIALLGDASAASAPDVPPPSAAAAADTGAASEHLASGGRAARTPPADRIRVSPLAQRIARAKGIDLGSIQGSGPNGRIVRGDLGLAIQAAVPIAATPPTAGKSGESPSPETISERRKLNGMRRTIARRLTESKQTVPHFYLTVRCNLDPLLALREELNAAAGTGGARISVNDMLMKAMAIALEDVPEAHVQFADDELLLLSRVDIAMAVAIDGGLVTPVIRDVGALSLSRIATTSRSLSDKARAGALLINPPQALILGFAAAIEQPWKVAGQLALARVMAATASFDHRAIDGAVAARFMAAFRAIVEAPVRILT